MWWLNRGCRGSVRGLGDVVAQLDKATGLNISGFDPGFLHSLFRGGRNYDCESKSNLRM
jgi:hypothetical protein